MLEIDQVSEKKDEIGLGSVEEHMDELDDKKELAGKERSAAAQDLGLTQEQEVTDDGKK